MKRFSNSKDNHNQSATTVLFSTTRSNFNSLINRNKVNNTINDFHNILKQLSGNDLSGLIKTALKRDPSRCKDILDEEFFKFITNSINASQYLSQSVLFLLFGRYSDNVNEQQNVPAHQSIDRQLWSLDDNTKYQN